MAGLLEQGCRSYKDKEVVEAVECAERVEALDRSSAAAPMAAGKPCSVERKLKHSIAMKNRPPPRSTWASLTKEMKLAIVPAMKKQRPGSKPMTQAEAARAFKISRNTVREAMKRPLAAITACRRATGDIDGALADSNGVDDLEVSRLRCR